MTNFDHGQLDFEWLGHRHRRHFPLVGDDYVGGRRDVHLGMTTSASLHWAGQTPIMALGFSSLGVYFKFTSSFDTPDSALKTRTDPSDVPTATEDPQCTQLHPRMVKEDHGKGGWSRSSAVK